MWARILSIVLRAGHDVLVLRPVPNEQEITDRPEVEWILLDCPDQTLRERLRERGWADDRVEDELRDGEVGRRLTITG